MVMKQFFRTNLCLFLGVLLFLAPVAESQTCEPELTAVFLVEGIYPGTALVLDLLHISEVRPATYPSDEELLQIVTAYYAADPLSDYYNHQVVATAGNFRLFMAQPMDFGAVTIVDIRDGTVVFAASMVWMGSGETVYPTVSTHDWLWEAGIPAAPPWGPEPIATKSSSWGMVKAIYRGSGLE